MRAAWCFAAVAALVACHVAMASLPRREHHPPFTTPIAQNRVFFNFGRLVATGLGGVFEVTLDMGTLTDGLQCNMTHPKFLGMTRALNYTMLRVGGTEGDFTFYAMNSTAATYPLPKPPAPFTRILTAGVWDDLMAWTKSVGLRVLFGLNAGPFVRDAANAWQPDNARTFVEHNARAHPGVIAGYEFGNEPNLYILNFKGSNPNGTQWALDMATVRGMLNSVDPSLLTLCCDVTYIPLVGEIIPFLQDFSKAGGLSHTNVSTWHYYPLFSERMDQYLPQWIDIYFATPARLAMPLTLNEAHKWASAFDKALGQPAGANVAPPRWLGETASACFGGEDGVSNRWVDALAAIDKAGIITRLGHQKSFRQELCATGWTNAKDPSSKKQSPPYSLIDLDLNPSPTFFATYLFRSLIGDAAYQSASSADDGLRAYLYSGKQGWASVVAVLVNPTDTPRSPELCFSTAGPQPAPGQNATLYQLSGCNETGAISDLSGTGVCSFDTKLTVDAETGEPSAIEGKDVTFVSVPTQAPPFHGEVPPPPSVPMQCLTVGTGHQLPPHSVWFVYTAIG